MYYIYILNLNIKLFLVAVLCSKGWQLVHIPHLSLVSGVIKWLRPSRTPLLLQVGCFRGDQGYQHLPEKICQRPVTRWELNNFYHGHQYKSKLRMLSQKPLIQATRHIQKLQGIQSRSSLGWCSIPCWLIFTSIAVNCHKSCQHLIPNQLKQNYFQYTHDMNPSQCLQ